MVDKTQKNSSQDVNLPEKAAPEAPETAKKSDEVKTQTDTVKKPAANAKKAKKSGGIFGKFVFFCMIALAALAAVPQIREKAVRVYHEKIEGAVIAKIEAFKGVPETSEAPVDENGTVAVVEEIVEEPVPMPAVDEPAADFVAQAVVVPEPAVEQPVFMAQPYDDTAALRQQLTDLENKNAALEMQVTRLENDKADTAAVLALMTRVAAAEKRVEASASEKEKNAVTMMVLAQLQNAAFSGKSFIVEQRALARLTESSPFLTEKMTVLKTFAEKGVWTQQMLQETFDEYARKVVTHDKTAETDGWWKKSLVSLKTLVVIRRTDADNAGATTDGILAQAENLLNANDLQGAVLVLKNLNNDDVSIIMPWISAAERTLIVQKTINEMTSYILSQKYAD